jgi:two-component system chemotaxis response regulator CheY
MPGDDPMARILVVDDDEFERTLSRTILQDAGHELRFAPNGEVALRIFKSQKFDVVITDLSMPNLDGHELIKELRALDPDVRVIVISGMSAEKLERAAVLGASFVIAKPYTPPQVLEAVTGLLDGSIAPPKSDFWF